MTDTLIIGRGLPNDAIRFGSTGTETKDLQRAVSLFQAKDAGGREGNVRLYIDRLRYLSTVKRLEILSEPESVITTFLGQAVHFLSRPSTNPTDPSLCILFPSVEQLIFGPGTFIDCPPLHIQPFFHALISSTPNLLSLYITLPPIDDTPRARPHPPNPSNRVTEYLRYAQSKRIGWTSLRYLHITGQFDGYTIPSIKGGKCHVTFRPSKRVWPAQAGSYHMATPSVILPGPTRRLARATGIKELVKNVIHPATGLCGGRAAGTEIRAEAVRAIDKEEAGRQEGMGIHVDVILEDYDTGLDEEGVKAVDGEWVEEKVRGFITSEYGKYGHEVMAEVQRRVKFNKTKS